MLSKLDPVNQADEYRSYCADVFDPAFSLHDVVRRHIIGAIIYHGKNLTSAAKNLGISRAQIYRKVKEYGI